MARGQRIDIGNRRELFTDHLLIDRLKKASLRLHEPKPENVILRSTKPWEGPFSIYGSLIHDGERLRLYYRASGTGEDKRARICLIESAEGIRFARPTVNQHPFRGSKQNNIVLAQDPFTHTFAPFLDTRPGVPKSERFKAFSRNATEAAKEIPNMDLRDSPAVTLVGFVSSDGYHWKRVQKKPLIVKGFFDSLNVGFWSEAEVCYVAYYRIFTKPAPDEAVGATTKANTFRRIVRATSRDFRIWSEGTVMDYQSHGKPAPLEEFYINNTHPYFRAPHLYIALPARFMDRRPALTQAESETVDSPDNQKTSCSDACFMTARPGATHYDRTFMEAFVKPGPEPGHWSGRCNYPVKGLCQTGRDEMSMYVHEFYGQKKNHIRRYSLRLDGFISVNAPHGGGEMITKPLTFSGSELELNYATSAAGSFRVEIQDAKGKPIPGFTLREAVDIFGNRIAGVARWKDGSDVSTLAGKPIRLRFVMRDADLYSLRFR